MNEYDEFRLMNEQSLSRASKGAGPTTEISLAPKIGFLLTLQDALLNHFGSPRLVLQRIAALENIPTKKDINEIGLTKGLTFR